MRRAAKTENLIDTRRSSLESLQNEIGQDEPQAELDMAKSMTIERLSIGPRLGICAEASAEKSIEAIAERSMLAEAAAAAEADAAA